MYTGCNSIRFLLAILVALRPKSVLTMESLVQIPQTTFILGRPLVLYIYNKVTVPFQTRDMIVNIPGFAIFTELFCQYTVATALKRCANVRKHI